MMQCTLKSSTDWHIPSELNRAGGKNEIDPSVSVYSTALQTDKYIFYLKNMIDKYWMLMLQ